VTRIVLRRTADKAHAAGAMSHSSSAVGSTRRPSLPTASSVSLLVALHVLGTYSKLQGSGLPGGAPDLWLGQNFTHGRDYLAVSK